MAGICSKAAGKKENLSRYNGNELQNQEFSDGNGLEFYDFKARSYDQQIGRFMQIDPLTNEQNQEKLTPYHFSYNNPVLYNDASGKCPACRFPLLKRAGLIKPIGNQSSHLTTKENREVTNTTYSVVRQKEGLLKAINDYAHQTPNLIEKVRETTDRESIQYSKDSKSVTLTSTREVVEYSMSGDNAGKATKKIYSSTLVYSNSYNLDNEERLPSKTTSEENVTTSGSLKTAIKLADNFNLDEIMAGFENMKNTINQSREDGFESFWESLKTIEKFNEKVQDNKDVKVKNK